MQKPVFSLTNTSLTASDISISYSGDANNATSIGDFVEVPRDPSSLNFTASPVQAEIVNGSRSHYYVQVNGRNPSGTVSLLDAQGNVLRVVNVVDNGWTDISLLNFNLPLGDNVLTIVYSGDLHNAASVTTIQQKVTTISTTLAALPYESNVVRGKALALQTSIVNSNATVNPPSGIVTFTDVTNSNEPLGTGTIINGVAAMTVDPTVLATWGQGHHIVRADYAGDAYNAASSTTFSLYPIALPSAVPVLDISSTVSSVAQGANLTLHAQVSTINGPATSAWLHGTVAFYDGKTFLGEARVTNGSADLVTKLSIAGSANIRAVYAASNSFGYTRDSEAVSDILPITVSSTDGYVPPVENRTPSTLSVRIDTSNKTGASSATIDNPVTLVATIGGEGNFSGDSMVAFFNGDQLIGYAPRSGNTATLPLGNFPVGAYSISAVYTGDTRFASSSAQAVDFQVNRAVTTSTLTAVQNPVDAKNVVTLLAKVSGKLLATGTVRFYNGDTLLGEATIASGLATLKAVVPPGVAQLRCEYSGDAASADSVSSVLAQVIYQYQQRSQSQCLGHHQ